MKKQLLIAAVAATMTSVAMADVSITGNAKFEYKNVDHTDKTKDANTTNTEVNLNFKGQSGDTAVVLNTEFNTHGDATNAIDVEDMYLTTKVGPVDAKLGNYATGTTALLGEIENGGRATNKVTLSTVFNGVKVYAGDSGGTDPSAVASELNGSMFAGISADVQGWTLQAKKNSSTKKSFGVAGKAGPIGIRYEVAKSDTANQDANFLNLTGEFSGVSVGFAQVKADSNDVIKEDDSDIFAVSTYNGDAYNPKGAVDNTDGNSGDSNKQLMASMKAAGNTITVKSGKITIADIDGAAMSDVKYNQLDVKRVLASGATLALTYTKSDQPAAVAVTQESKKTFEIDLSVKF